jgi:hypothetical protein
MVLSKLNSKHRWSFKDLLYYMVTEEATKKNRVSCSVRARALSDAIFEQKEVVERLARVSNNIWFIGNTKLIQRLHSELRSISKIDVGIGEFDSNMDVTSLDIPGLAERVQKAAPELWQLLESLIEPQDTRSNRDSFKDNQGSIVMVSSILAHARAPKMSNNFPLLLGLHLYSMGVKRRTINVLAGLGITISYRTVTLHRKELSEIGKVSESISLPPLLLFIYTVIYC